MVKCAIFDIVDNVSPGISWLASLDLLVSRRTKTYFMLAPWMSGIYFYSFSSFILMSGSFFQYFFFGDVRHILLCWHFGTLHYPDKVHRIFRHARVSSTYPCLSVRWLVGWSHFWISNLPASLVALCEKLKREDHNFFNFGSGCS